MISVNNARPKLYEVEMTEMATATEYQTEIKRIKTQMIEEIRKMWPCKSVDASSIQTRSKTFNMDQACNEISQLLHSRYKNNELRRFTQKIEEIFAGKLRHLSSFLVIDQPEWAFCVVYAQKFHKHVIDFEAKMCSNYHEHAGDIAVVRGIYEEDVKMCSIIEYKH